MRFCTQQQQQRHKQEGNYLEEMQAQTSQVAL
jgi:hypothetical protein